MAALWFLLAAAMGLLLTPASAAAPPRPEAKPSDTDALTMFRLGADLHGILANNWTTPDACAGRWAGVGCSPDGRRVTSLSLPSLDLRGALDPLSHLASLRALDLRGNRLNGTLGAFFLGSGAGGIQTLYLSSNDLSGDVSGVSRLSGLTKLDLADNSFSGPVPAPALANLSGLLTLKLQDNLFDGLLPDVATILPRLLEFNASNNRLSGRVPDAVRARFGLASLAGNAGLCGLVPPLPPCSFLPPREPAPTSSSVVPSNPAASSSSSSVAPAALATPEGAGTSKGGGLSAGAIAGIAVGNGLFLLALLSLLLAYCCCLSNAGRGRESAARKRNRVGLEDGDGGIFGGHGKMQPARPGSATGRCSDDSDGARSKLVFFGDDDSDSSTRRTASKREVKFELDELLRASAEMVGRGSLGTVYRAALPDGRMVAVKRLRDANPCGRDEFRRYMDLIGRLRHPNLVPLRAFYYARQEKLLVYDYFPGSSLHRRLHCRTTPSSSSSSPAPALGWASRVRLLLGAARGLARIHGEYRGAAIPHGNVKSANVLLLGDNRAMVADFGLALLLSPAHAVARLGGYTAPEQRVQPPRLSQEADVYGFGVLVLEALTGKVPAAQEEDGGGRDRRQGQPRAAAMAGLPEWVRSVVREEWTAEVFDVELLRERGVEEEMVAVLHVALACVAEAPAQRPAMADVVRMLESVPVDEEEEDVSVSPSAGVTTEDDALSY